MSDIPPIKPTASPTASPVRPAATEGGPAERPARPAPPGVDRVEISEMGQLLSTLDPAEDIRIEKVMEVREAILNGTYESEAKLEYTLNRLLEVLK